MSEPGRGLPILDSRLRGNDKTSAIRLKHVAPEAALFANDEDTIFAPASGAGRAAIAVLRMSGPGCSAALQAIAPGAEFPDRRAVLRTLRHPQSGEPLDRALITRFQAPRSFTGEEMAEISVTGGRAVTAAVVKALGARSRTAACRARRIRLARLREGQDRPFRSRGARRPGRGGNRGAAAAGAAHRRRGAEPRVRGDPRKPARGDGGGRGADRFFRRRGRGGFHAGIGETRGARARSSGSTGRSRPRTPPQRLREGFTVVIAGPPNVGKSTLMNALAGRDVAITSPIPGTTRDLIEVFLDLRGYPVILVDTAGIRESADPIEQEGRRASAPQREERGPDAVARRRRRRARRRTWARQRSRCGPRSTSPRRPRPARAPAELAISAKTGAGIDRLLDALADLAEERMSSASRPC